jgi:hypothetical protein
MKTDEKIEEFHGFPWSSMEFASPGHSTVRPDMSQQRTVRGPWRSDAVARSREDHLRKNHGWKTSKTRLMIVLD